MEEFLSATLRGLSFGSVYALLAIGLVLTYKTSGVFHLAYGAQAFVSAVVFYEARVRHEWPIWAAALLAIGVIAPLIGIALEMLLFRYLRRASELAKLVTSIGLLIAIPEIVKLWFEATAGAATSLAPDGEVTYRPFGDVFLNRNDLFNMAAVVIIVVGLTVMFRYTAIGLRMRAVVESSRMTELAGINADRVSVVSWVLSSVMAGLAGVLLLGFSQFAQVRDQDFTVLVTAAIAAAVFAGLTSIPRAFIGGLALGIGQQLLTRYLPTGNVLAQNLRPALPFIALFLVLILMPSLRGRRQATDPLAGVDPPPPAPISTEVGSLLKWGTRGFWTVIGLITAYYIFFSASARWVDIAVRATILSTIFLSIVVITGLAGQISLCQATFAAIGACATAQLATKQGMSVLVAMLVGAAIAAAVGALLALPALRLGGIFLSLATFAFALFFDSVMVKFDWVGGGVAPIRAPRPQAVGSIDFENDKTFLVLAIVVFTISALLVILVRGATTGRFLRAIQGSEVAASSIGINRNRARITAFAISAAIAGVGGGMLAMYEGRAYINPNFVPFQGLVWVVLVVTLGSRTVEGAVQAGVGFFVFREVFLEQVLPWSVNNVVDPLVPFWHIHMGEPSATIAFIFFGLGAITYAKHPEGVLEFNKRKSMARIQARLDRR
ncbi:MAG TPA: ABC transporter permease, partial [Acidimicrobiia bacterium]|nr:ABC transporter permease [Acidimicrobiia bacterium]